MLPRKSSMLLAEIERDIDEVHAAIKRGEQIKAWWTYAAEVDLPFLAGLQSLLGHSPHTLKVETTFQGRKIPV